jgi:hypothetical protein
MQNMKIFWNLFSLFLHPRVRGLAFCSIEIIFTREICWSQVCQVPPCACACLRVCVHWVRVCVFVCLCVFSKRRGCLRTRTNLRQTRRASPQGFLATPKWSQEKPREFYPRIRREQGAWNCGGCQCAVRWVLCSKNQRVGDFVSEGSTRQVAGVAEVRLSCGDSCRKKSLWMAKSKKLSFRFSPRPNRYNGYKTAIISIRWNTQTFA